MSANARTLAANVCFVFTSVGHCIVETSPGSRLGFDGPCAFGQLVAGWDTSSTYGQVVRWPY